MKLNENSKNETKTNKFSRELNINKKLNLKIKSKSNNKVDIKLTKPIKIKSLNKFKNNFQHNRYNTQLIKNIQNDSKEKEIDASIEDLIEKETIKPINSNKNLIKNNTTIFGTHHYIRISDKSPFRIVKNTKTQIVANDMNNISNVINYQFVNGGNGKHNHGKSLNVTLTNKSPIRLRKINVNKKYGCGTECLSTTTITKNDNKLTNIYNNSHKNINTNMNIYSNTNINNNVNDNNNNTNTESNNNQPNEDESTIISLKKEIENLKRENLYKEIIIKDMKQQLDEIKKEKDKKLTNGTSSLILNNNVQKLKQELGIKNNRIYKEDINSNIKDDDNNNSNFNNKEEAILFDKLKSNYSNNKKLIIELLKENEKMKKKINDSKILYGIKKRNYLYLLYEKKKEASLNFISKEKKKEIIDNNNSYEEEETDFISDYIENSLKSKNISLNNNKERMIDNKQKNNVKLMIKMTLNSNDIPEDEIISLFMNNLLNYQNSIEIFITKYMKTDNSLDNEIIKDYFNSIYFNNNNKFSIYNIFKGITEFYDEEAKKLQNFQIDEFISQKKNISAKIIKECKLNDTLKTGQIEINKFKNILDKCQFYKSFDKNENELFNILIYIMKKKINNEKIGLFHLFYYNLSDDFCLNDSSVKDNTSNNNSFMIDRNEGEKKISLFHKTHEKKESNDKIVHAKITSNVDFKNNANNKERGSDNSNNTYILLSSQKFSFDYSSKSGSKEAAYIREGIKEITSNYLESDEHIETVCKDYVDNIFNICMDNVKRNNIII